MRRDEYFFYARERSTLSPWRTWVTEQGLAAKIERLGSHSKKHFGSLAYSFMLTVGGFESTVNKEELLSQMRKEFLMVDPKEGFAISEEEGQEEARHENKKGDWSRKRPKYNKRARA